MHRVRVLVVEENRDHADTLVMLLESFGCVALSASNATAALALIHAHKPDVLITEDDIPAVAGVVHATRAENRLGALIVCVTTAAQRDFPVDYPCDVRLVKPYDFDRIWSAVGSFVTRREAQKRGGSGPGGAA